MIPYSPTVDTNVPAAVRAAILQDSPTVGFFGADRIRQHDAEEFRYWTPPTPYLAIVPDLLKDENKLSDRYEGGYAIDLVGHFPALFPVDPSLTPPTPIDATPSGTGLLTGKYSWAWTGNTATSATRVLVGNDNDPVFTTPIDLTAQGASIPLPAETDFESWDLWRTKANGTAFFFRKTIPVTATGPFIDTAADDVLQAELAPIPDASRRVMARLKAWLRANQDLKRYGRAQADKITNFQDQALLFRRDTNQRLYTLRSIYHLYFDSARQSQVAPP